MKKILLCLSLLAVFSVSRISAQSIPNAGFETFSNLPSNIPDGWDSISGSVKRSGQISVQSGSQTITAKAVKGNWFVSLFSQVDTTIKKGYPGIIRSRFPYADRPDSFGAYFMYLAKTTNEYAGFTVAMTKWNTTSGKRDTILIATISIPSSGGALFPWRRLQMGLKNQYKSTATPDSATIVMYSNLPITGSNISANTLLAVDELSFFNSTVGIDEPSPFAGNFYNAPNPFHGETNIWYALRESSEVSLKVYDMQGKEVADQAPGFQESGLHQAAFNATGLKPGLYIYKLQAGAISETRKMVVE